MHDSIPGPRPPEFSVLEHRLREGLGGPLPGPAAQTTMAPFPEGGSPRSREGGGVPAAVLLLLYPLGDSPTLLLTVRSRRLPKHGGQVALPGGVVEADETHREAAIREAEEEVGVAPEDVRILGRLSPLHIPVTGFLLHPFVGAAHPRPRFRPEPGEVARLLEIDLAELLDPACRRTEHRTIGARPFEVPYFALAGEKIWGATAMILAEFIALLDPAAGARRERGSGK